MRPVKGQILRLRLPPELPQLERTVRGVVQGASIYLVPRSDGELVVGATVEERGADTSVTAGAVYSLCRDAQLVVPAVAEAELVEASAGLRPGSHDNSPYVGATEVPGLLVATGHYRNGILLAPLTAEIVGELLAGRPMPAFATPFAPARAVAAPA